MPAGVAGQLPAWPGCVLRDTFGVSASVRPARSRSAARYPLSGNGDIMMRGGRATIVANRAGNIKLGEHYRRPQRLGFPPAYGADQEDRGLVATVFINGAAVEPLSGTVDHPRRTVNLSYW